MSEELERAHATSGLGVNVANAEFPLTIRYQGRSEIVYNQEALDDLIDYLVNNGVAYSLDSTSDVEPVQIPVGDEIEGMAEIRNIVRSVLSENPTYSISKALFSEADTSAYAGDHDPIYIEIPALESLATQENFDGEKVWHGQYDATAIADILEEDEPTIEDYRYDESAHQEALDKWNKIHSALDDFDRDDKKELAVSIRNAVKEADDSGYGY